MRRKHSRSLRYIEPGRLHSMRFSAGRRNEIGSAINARWGCAPPSPMVRKNTSFGQNRSRRDAAQTGTGSSIRDRGMAARCPSANPVPYILGAERRGGGTRTPTHNAAVRRSVSVTLNVIRLWEMLGRQPRSRRRAPVGRGNGRRNLYSTITPTASPMPTASATRSLPLAVPAGRVAS